MAENEQTSVPIAKLASRILRLNSLDRIKLSDVHALAASVLTQRPDRKFRPPKGTAFGFLDIKIGGATYALQIDAALHPSIVPPDRENV